MGARLVRDDVRVPALLLAHREILHFFFSSRRRHTRYIGDWSSDVCSSDLTTGWSFLQRTSQKSLDEKPFQCNICFRRFKDKCNLANHKKQKHKKPKGQQLLTPYPKARPGGKVRSEERRVGKACRTQRDEDQ